MLLQQQAQKALTDAAPELAKLQLAQPAAQLRPLWDSQQEQTTRLAQTKQRIVEVNTRLQAKAAQRSRIRHTALRTHAQLQSDLTIRQHGWRSMNVTACGAEIAGWRAHFAQLNRDKHQIATLAARIAELRQKLAGMPETPDADGG